MLYYVVMSPIQSHMSTGSTSTWQHASRRSAVMATRGMCCSSQPLASQIGSRILDSGGNCVDAAVAMAAALGVIEPCSTGMGGDCFALYFDASTGRVHGLNGSGRAPAELTLQHILNELGDQHVPRTVPMTSLHAITVPGAVAGWVDAVTSWGKLDMHRVLAPAIQLAERGFPVPPISAELWHDAAHKLNGDRYDLLVGDRPPRAGELFRNPNLANAMRRVAEHGRAGFYQGETAAAILSAVQARGSLMTQRDLDQHQSEFVEPLTTNYRGVDVWEIPPNGQGITALLALNILQETTPALSELQFGSAEHLHRLVQCMRLAFADTRYYVGDPAHGQVPVAELLSREYAQRRAALINQQPNVAFAVENGQPVNTCDTVSLCVVDEHGNACSFINSVYESFGSGLVPAHCGFTLHNRGANFVLHPDHPNCVAGSKRPYHTIIPGMATLNGRLWAPFSVMGGFMQPQGHVQVLTNMIDFGLDAQTALDAPRFCIDGFDRAGDSGHGDQLALEQGISDTVVHELKQMGHASIKQIRGSARRLFGRGQVIRVLHSSDEADSPSRVLWAGSGSFRH